MSENPELPPLPDWAEAMLPKPVERLDEALAESVRQIQARLHEQDITVPVSPSDHNWEHLLLPAEQSAPPELTPIKSTNIAAVGHDGTALLVKFQNGTLYRYPTVGPDLHAGLIAASSPGQYFHHRIKSAHRGERVT